jgi:hypothetical protein
LGLRGLSASNKNMLTQAAATYVYRSDALGNALGLLSAEVQTWSNSWSNYRNFTGTAYDEVQEQTSTNNPVWRKGSAYIWKGDITALDNYGSRKFTSSNNFDFTSPLPSSNLSWQYQGEYLKFDHFGMPLETVDYTGKIYSATKMGYDNRVTVATAINARYGEIAFSSAEDKINGYNFFGGEVSLGSGNVVSNPYHTGKSSLSLSTGYGFVFNTSGDILKNKTYKASVWASSVNGKIYYKVNNGSEVIPTQTVSQAINVPGGTWYKIDVSIPVGNLTNPSLEVGVKSSTGTLMYFDDFRFQPADAVMSCNVYPPLNFEFVTDFKTYTYTLDNDNLYTKQEISADGLNVKTYVESIQYQGEKFVLESKRDYRRFYVNQ